MITYRWKPSEGESHFAFSLVRAPGTQENGPYPFGDRPGGNGGPFVAPPGFYIGIVPVFQAFWSHLMGASANPSVDRRHEELPVENVSWDSLHAPGGFLDRLNASPIRMDLIRRAPVLNPNSRFRLPAETEWEYAARGGPHWPDGFAFSGGNDVAAVAWHDRRHGDHTRPVALKAPNQLGLYDMSGNVWEWCEDVFSPDPSRIPGDGSAYQGAGEERVFRGGCFHNWAVHCTVSKRYAIARDAHDGCIGFRLVLA
jgi:formylglycine-generating enzyme required for sulfatase activity